jgi:outer membrane cobalamin receptor
MRLAGRYDYHQHFDDQLCPDLSLIWLACGHISLSASLRRSYRAPTFNDLYWPRSEFDYDFDGQPDYGESGNVRVRPEKAVALQLGTRARLGWITGDLTIFRREVRDLIQWDNVDESYTHGYWMPTNRSEATIQGFECQATAKPVNNLGASLAYAFMEAEDNLLTKSLPYQPHHRFSGHLQYGLILVAAQLEIIARLELEYLGERYADTWELEELPSTLLCKGKLTLRALEMTVYLAGENLGDQHYVLRDGYPLSGRAFRGGICWDFWD